MTKIRFENSPSTNTPINADNLNKLNNVVISATEPTTGEEVWIQKSKNLYSGGNVSGTRYITRRFNQLPAGTYTLSALATSNDTNASTCLIYDTINERTLGQLSRNTRSSLTFTTTSPITEIAFCGSDSIANSTNDTFSFTDIQIESGSTASGYEPYVDKKIYTKNANGVYEEFNNQSGTILYDNSSGSNGTITLSDSAANYAYIEVYFKTNEGYYNFVKITDPNGKSIYLNGGYPMGDSRIYIKTTIATISGVSITPNGYNEFYVNVPDKITTISETNAIFITKVIGYK